VFVVKMPQNWRTDEATVLVDDQDSSAWYQASRGLFKETPAFSVDLRAIARRIRKDHRLGLGFYVEYPLHGAPRLGPGFTRPSDWSGSKFE
jgi:hypothetical protein